MDHGLTDWSITKNRQREDSCHFFPPFFQAAVLEKHLSGYDERTHVPSRKDAASKLAPMAPVPLEHKVMPPPSPDGFRSRSHRGIIATTAATTTTTNTTTAAATTTATAITTFTYYYYYYYYHYYYYYYYLILLLRLLLDSIGP